MRDSVGRPEIPQNLPSGQAGNPLSEWIPIGTESRNVRF
jgi:hypothetical protein